ncbi:MAG: hypothetical protein OXU74_06190 [Gemmatimonadota bacterium]|nr:hypothetical protein [Gemmatimonadota bacterium]
MTKTRHYTFMALTGLALAGCGIEVNGLYFSNQPPRVSAVELPDQVLTIGRPLTISRAERSPGMATVSIVATEPEGDGGDDQQPQGRSVEHGEIDAGLIYNGPTAFKFDANGELTGVELDNFTDTDFRLTRGEPMRVSRRCFISRNDHAKVVERDEAIH